MLSQEMGWTCVTNDQKLKKACTHEQVSTLGGFGLLNLLVQDKILTIEEGVIAITAIGRGNNWISPSLIEDVISQLQATHK
jgi:predicted polyphosphate/ATP-dependent NAD kinase